VNKKDVNEVNEKDYEYITKTFSDILEACDLLKTPQAEALIPVNPSRWTVTLAIGEKFYFYQYPFFFPNSFL
jgi:hypothetical protein